MSTDDRKWEIIESEYLIRRPWLTARRDRVKLPTGVEIPEYYILEYPDWVNVIAITKEGKFVLVRQYRHGIKETRYEICAGVCETGEEPLLSAQRELYEETGYGNGNWTKLMTISANASTMTNITHCYLATEVERISTQHLEETEDLTVHLLDEEEVKALLLNNDNNTILGFDVNLICDFFLNTERQGPGSPEVTLKALSFIDNLTDKSLIADLGCGTGGQTMILAQHAPGKITGIDFFPGFIERFNKNAEKLNLQNRVKGIVGSMDDLSFEKDSLDLIWSEGAIYNIGFERGLKEWRNYLKPGGYLAVSESVWFTDQRPAEIHDFWMSAYTEIDTVPNKVAQIQKAGYIPVATFILPENCWIEHYFAPQAKAEEIFRRKHAGSRIVEELITSNHHEAELYSKYKAYYGYAFFICKKGFSLRR
jgi:ubiquinone/menaquinone biosynthesis C-methylase UbiE/8-oxo-dGTP pyrophosphatase MutT (NUDIX family)